MPDLARQNPRAFSAEDAELLRNNALTPLLGGYAADLLFDGREVTCLFNSYESARNFLRFSELYVSDAQPGNPYGGYFPSAFCESAARPYRVLFPRAKHSWEIWPSTVNHMFHAVCSHRLNVDPEANWKDPPNSYQTLWRKWENAQPQMEVRGRYTSFSFDESKLPPRMQPGQRGDFVFVVDDPRFRREQAYFITELNGQALVALIHFPNPPANEDLVLVNRAHLMLTHDLYQESEFRARECGYRRMKEALLQYALGRLRENGLTCSHELPQE